MFFSFTDPCISRRPKGVDKDLKNGDLTGIHCLVNMPYPGQRFKVDDAIKIEVEKLADLVVLSDGPYTVKPDKIQDISMLKTIVGGKKIGTQYRC